MNEHLIADLGRFVDERDVVVDDAPGHITLRVVRSGLSFAILIPREVLEWWVEVNDALTGSKIEDWCDYVGYDATPEGELAEEMRADVMRFVENALARPLRTVRGGRILEWNVGGDWLQAVPFAANPERRAARDARNTRV